MLNNEYLNQNTAPNISYLHITLTDYDNFMTHSYTLREASR